MTITFTIDFTKIYQILWFFQDRCRECGGNLSIHINNKYYCDECGELN